jgi:hypothetical protein
MTKWQMKQKLGCLWRPHKWRIYQHNINASENMNIVFVIAWKQCERCAKSKLIHLLE